MSGARDVFVVIVATTLVIWVMGPSLMIALRRLSIRSRSLESPDAARPRGDDALYQQRFDQFAALGFQPVGIETQITWFLSPWDWRRKFESRWMALPDGQTFASLTKMIPEDPWRFGLVTALSDGCIVRTSCPGVNGLENPLPNYRLSRLPGADPAELLKRHRDHVAAVCRERGATVETAALARLGTLEAALSKAFLNRLPNNGQAFLMMFFAPVLCVLTITMSTHHGLRALDLAYAGGIASILTWLFFDFVLIPRHRAAIVASHSDPRR